MRTYRPNEAYKYQFPSSADPNSFVENHHSNTYHIKHTTSHLVYP